MNKTNCLNTFFKKNLKVNQGIKTFAFLTFIFGCFSLAYADNSKIFIQSKEKIKGFAGLATKNNGELLLAANPKNVRIFDPDNQEFKGNDFKLPFYSFADDIALIPKDKNRNIPGGYALTCFLDGRIITVLNDGSVIESNQGQFFPIPETGIFQAEFNLELLGVNPIAYRSSNDRLYVQSAFDPTKLYKLDWRGSIPESISLDTPVGLNAFQFGPDDKLYAPDVAGNRIVKIDVDTGAVTSVVGDIPSPIAVKVDSQGILYFISRTTGNVYRYNPGTNALTVLASAEPALDNLSLNKEETKLYVTNDQNKIFEVDIEDQTKKILFRSPIVQPWDLAFDPETKSLYVADFGSLKQFDSRTSSLQRKVILDDANSGLAGYGSVSGITVEEGPNAKIVISDVTIGNIFAINKNDFTSYDFFNGFETGLFGKQPFSSVRITGGTPEEFYLVANAVDGTIVKLYHTNTGAVNETYFSGLRSPVKLKIYNGYLYVVEAGLLNQGVPNSGRISRISLANQTQEILVENLDNPQGLDIINDKLVIVEAGSKKLISASAITPGNASVIKNDLKLSEEIIISSFNPIPINPFVGVAVDTNGKRIFVNQTKPNNILLLKRQTPL
ncbi:YncE family protein [Criblamydia sequanensis]|uniref:Secreted protein n=1 Tax=Candidatus Criblamydia sequanensis CRIB-18 TaxID=1437425 RepID=A0A090D165_9BACT|nr:YncE family protein [Criblamydia sequanensis]CDR33645.1 putative secreted protein [Criblamydia sequanensis CRIB-18]